MKNLFIVIIALSTFLVSCNNCCQNECESECEEKENQDYLINATLWYQCSGELKACYYQTFALAKLMLENNFVNDTTQMPLAVVLDIDETLLNNSNYNGFMVVENKGFNIEDWISWTSKATAEALPGAIDFLEFAKELGVEIFYISNRLEEELPQTISNMEALDFPEIRSENFLLKSTTSNKHDRRQTVLENYNIILFVGDNLADFSNDFDGRTDNYAFEAVEQNKDNFGTKYIILPNPMYGSWEKGILTGGEDKYQERISHIKSF